MQPMKPTPCDGLTRNGPPGPTGCFPSTAASGTSSGSLSDAGFTVSVGQSADLEENNLHFLCKVSHARRKELGEGGIEKWRFGYAQQVGDGNGRGRPAKSSTLSGVFSRTVARENLDSPRMR